MRPAGRDHSLPDAGLPSEGIQKAVQVCLESSRRHLTAHDLERLVVHQKAWPRRRVRKAIRDLIARGVLEYIYIFGQSYLEMSFHQPVDVSPRFTIVPPTYTGYSQPHRHHIAIAPGVSFGCGRHATTRLALQVLETAWDYLRDYGIQTDRAVIDIGTGSGILAIAAACLGATRVLALDIDACARSEARQNIHMNINADRVTVSGQPLESVQERFNIIMANLRLPTLVAYADWMHTRLCPPGVIVVSGFRKEEWIRLRQVFGEKGFHGIGYRDMQGWAAGAFWGST